MRAFPAVRPMACLVAAVGLVAGGTGWPAAAQPASPETAQEVAREAAQPRVGIPPAVDLARLPRPDDSTPREYDGSIPGDRVKIGPPALDSNQACVSSATVGDQLLQSRPWGQLRLRFPELWQFAPNKGAGQRIAVIDTGVIAHPRLGGRLVDGGDYVLNRSGVEDCDGHGTLVAGIIAADERPDTGFAGIAPQATILSVRQSSEWLKTRYRSERPQSAGQEFSFPSGDTTTMARAIRHAVDVLGATVINISESACLTQAVGNLPKAGQAHAPDLQAAVRYATDHNVVVVVAAGNVDQSRCPQNGGTVNSVASPAWFDDDVLAVAAMQKNGEPAVDFTLAGPWVDVGAPGTEITSLDPASDRLANQTIRNGQRGLIQGTSFATPYVAGLAALIRERYPNLNARQVMHRIEQTAQRPGGKGGRNDLSGFGMINGVAALTAVIPEEFGATPPRAGPGRLENLMPAPRKDPVPTRVALIGSGAGLGLLGVTMFVVYTVQRSRRRAAMP